MISLSNPYYSHIYWEYNNDIRRRQQPSTPRLLSVLLRISAAAVLPSHRLFLFLYSSLIAFFHLPLYFVVVFIPCFMFPLRYPNISSILLYRFCKISVSNQVFHYKNVNVNLFIRTGIKFIFPSHPIISIVLLSFTVKYFIIMVRILSKFNFQKSFKPDQCDGRPPCSANNGIY